MPSAKRKIFVTGAAGFVGASLVAFLRKRGESVTPSAVDLLDVHGLTSELEQITPGVVIHLAAISHVLTCERDPASAFRSNVGGTASLLEAMRRGAPAARLVFASTAQVYQAPSLDEGTTIVMDERRTIAPQNLYARTKWDCEVLIESATRRDGLEATVLRLFNHTHKSQSPDFLVPHLYSAIREGMRAEAAGRIQVPVGNLELRRDIGSIQDLVAAFAAVLDRTEAADHEVFSVCSGTAKRLSTLAHQLAAQLDAKVDFVTDPGRVRVGEPDVIRGSHERFTNATGWRPTVTNEEALIEAFLAELPA